MSGERWERALPAPPPSPCIKICVMAEDGYCTGCRRTIEEIARWCLFNDDEKRAVLAVLPSRAGSG